MPNQKTSLGHVKALGLHHLHLWDPRTRRFDCPGFIVRALHKDDTGESGPSCIDHHIVWPVSKITYEIPGPHPEKAKKPAKKPAKKKPVKKAKKAVKKSNKKSK